MSKTSYVLIIVLSTLQCLDNGKRAVFLPSPEPQKVPKDAAETALEKGLAKKPAKAPKKPATKSAPGGGNTPNPDEVPGEKPDGEDEPSGD